MVQAVIAQKSSDVDTNLQKIGADMITMFRVAKKEKQTENRLNQDFSQDDNDVKKMTKVVARAPARKRYSTTKIKARNFLTNIPYRRYKKSDFINGNFVIGGYFFLLQNLNPLMIDRKCNNENDRKCINMLWQKGLLQQFTQYIFLYDNFLTLSLMEITYQKANSVVKQFLTEYQSVFNHLKHCLAENGKVIQYLYMTLLPKYYSCNNKFGIQNKSLVDLAYREWMSRNNKSAS